MDASSSSSSSSSASVTAAAAAVRQSSSTLTLYRSSLVVQNVLQSKYDINYSIKFHYYILVECPLLKLEVIMYKLVSGEW